MWKKAILSKLIFISLVLSMLAYISPLFAAQTSKTPRYGGILKLSDLSDGQSIGYPSKMSPVYGNRQAAPAIEPLFRTDKTGKPVPWLAMDEIGDVAAKTLTLPLRKGVKFHDGSDFNAEAVKWNLDQMLAAKRPGTETWKSIDIVDDYTVRINLTQWDNTITGNFTYMTGMIISPTAYKKNGQDWCENHPVGTGPFEFVSWQKDARTVYKKFPGYWQKGKPYLDGIEWTPMADQLTRQFSLRKGEIDLAIGIARKDLASMEKEGYVVSRTRIGSGAYVLIPDSANPNSPFADIRVRQAVGYAIDTEAIVKGILYGEAEPTNQYAYKGHWGYNPSVIGYPYNPAKAKQLLAEAGYTNGFKTKILYVTSADTDLLYTAVQGYLKAVGIDVELDPATTARHTQISLGGAKWEGLVHQGVMPNTDTAGLLATRFRGGGKFVMMLVPDDYAKTIQDAIAAPDFKTKQKYTWEAMKLMIDKYCLMIGLWSWSDCAVSKSYLHNHGFMDTPNTAWWTPEEAWLEK